MAQQALQRYTSKTNVKDAAKGPDSLLIQASGTRDLSQVNYSRSGVTEKGSSLSVYINPQIRKRLRIMGMRR